MMLTDYDDVWVHKWHGGMKGSL